jgi:hypothetical protein
MQREICAITGHAVPPDPLTERERMLVEALQQARWVLAGADLTKQSLVSALDAANRALAAVQQPQRAPGIVALPPEGAL